MIGRSPLPFLLCSIAILVGCSPAVEPAGPRRAESDDSAPSVAGARISQAIAFEGFGPAAFGAPEEAVRQAWGRGLTDSPPSAGSSCRYLTFAPGGPQAAAAIAFMIEDGKFVRLDVLSADYLAPGGGRVGTSTASLRRLYAGRLEELPHKYVDDGGIFVVTPAGGEPARLIFETDASGSVTAWRIGVPPQVHYVEGCS